MSRNFEGYGYFKWLNDFIATWFMFIKLRFILTIIENCYGMNEFGLGNCDWNGVCMEKGNYNLNCDLHGKYWLLRLAWKWFVLWFYAHKKKGQWILWCYFISHN